MFIFDFFVEVEGKVVVDIIDSYPSYLILFLEITQIIQICETQAFLHTFNDFIQIVHLCL